MATAADQMTALVADVHELTKLTSGMASKLDTSLVSQQQQNDRYQRWLGELQTQQQKFQSELAALQTRVPSSVMSAQQVEALMGEHRNDVVAMREQHRQDVKELTEGVNKAQRSYLMIMAGVCTVIGILNICGVWGTVYATASASASSQATHGAKP